MRCLNMVIAIKINFVMVQKHSSTWMGGPRSLHKGVQNKIGVYCYENNLTALIERCSMRQW